MKNVLGMGNALVDILIRVEDDTLIHHYELPRGGMKLVPSDVITSILKDAESMKIEKASGGSAANSIHGLANLGIETGFIGKVGNDDLGDFFCSDLISSGIKPFLLKGYSQTGVAVALVTPDSERTFAVYLGSAIEMVPEDLEPRFFEGYEIFHIEGYLVQNHGLIEKAIQLAKQAGCKISLDLASYDVVRGDLEFIRHLVENYVDILFANETEAREFTGKDPFEAIHDLGKLVETAILKIGKDGSLIVVESIHTRVNALPATPIDTTGAGDLFAAGYLYGMLNNLETSASGYIGSLLASRVIEVMGAKINGNTWEQIRKLVTAGYTGIPVLPKH